MKEHQLKQNEEPQRDLQGNKGLSYQAVIQYRMGSIIQRAKRRKVSYKSADASEVRDWREEDREIKGRNIATLYYTIKSTGKEMSTSEHSDGVHSEKLIMEELVSLYGADYKSKLIFDTLYTERDACGSDYHNCRINIFKWFPGVSVTYSADYPSEGEVSDDSADDSDDKTTLMHRREKAKRRRAKGTKKVKRADKHAGKVAKGDVTWSDFEDSADEL